jgi:hypothetical protein
MPDPDDIFDLLRGDNLAPEQDDPFFAALAMSAVTSASSLQIGRDRRRRVAFARLGAVMASATLIVSGGAMASALFLVDDHDRPPGRGPAESGTVSGTPTSSPDEAPARAPGISLLPGMLEPGLGRGPVDGSADPGPNDNADGHAKGPGEAPGPNENADGHAEGPGEVPGPNENADGHADGPGEVPEPNENADGNANNERGALEPKRNGNRHQELTGQESTLSAGTD